MLTLCLVHIYQQSGIYLAHSLPFFRNKGQGNDKGMHPFKEIKGNFVDGMLQNNDGAEGQGGSNFLRSILFDDERLWGP